MRDDVLYDAALCERAARTVVMRRCRAYDERAAVRATRARSIITT